MPTVKPCLCAAALIALAAATGSADAALVISNDPTSNVICASGTCTATAADAVLNATDLAGMLATSNVTVQSGSLAQDIDIETSVSWTSANRLTLDSFHGIAFDASLSVTGPGGLAIATNDGGSGGDFAFASGASADFWDPSSSLVVDGAPYTLEADLPTLASAVAANPSGFYALAKSYDASADGIHAQAPMPGTFSGSLEGLGHTISNLTVRTSHKKIAALIEQTAHSAFLRDLVLANAAMTGGHAAGFVGVNYGAVIQCAMSGSVDGIDFVGGIVGRGLDGYVLRAHASVRAAGDAAHHGGDVGGIVGEVEFNAAQGSNPMQGIFQSDADGSIRNAADGGGIVGHMLNVPVDHARAAVNVSASTYAGGIAGTDYGSIAYSSASGAASVGDNGYAGGMAGYMQGSVAFSFATGNAHGGNGSNVGGLVGGGLSGITDSYAMGTARAGTGSNVGGLVGQAGPLDLEVQQSYSIGAPHAPAGSAIGGLVGDGSMLEPTADYFDTTTSGVNAKNGARNCSREKLCRHDVKGLTDAELRAALPSGLSAQVWAQSPSVNNGYPYLLANPPQ
jgi:hypothetical protein